MIDDETKKEIAYQVSLHLLDSIKSDVIPAVEGSIKTTVNGKIDNLSEKIDNHINEMKPLLDALRVVQSLQKFCKWVGIPFIVVVAPVWYWLNRI